MLHLQQWSRLVQRLGEPLLLLPSNHLRKKKEKRCVESGERSLGTSWTSSREQGGEEGGRAGRAGQVRRAGQGRAGRREGREGGRAETRSYRVV